MASEIEDMVTLTRAIIKVTLDRHRYVASLGTCRCQASILSFARTSMTTKQYEQHFLHHAGELMRQTLMLETE